MKEKSVQTTFWVGLVFSIAPLSLFATNDLWIGTGSNNNLNTAGNWSAGVPNTTLTAVFDNTTSDINTTPTASSNFSASALDFDNLASPFSFTFDNCTLTLAGSGITGTNTDTTITSTNTNNTSTITGQLLFTNVTSASSGSALLYAVNDNTVSGAVSSAQRGVQSSFQIGYGVDVPFSMASSGVLSAVNSAEDTTTGTGVNEFGFIEGNQIEFDGTFTAIDDVTITLSNTGTNSSSGHGSSTAIVNGQFLTKLAFSAGNGLNISATNMGTDASTGTGDNQVGYLDNNQLRYNNTVAIGDSATIILSNAGTNSSSGHGSFTGFGLRQLLLIESFTAGDDFIFSATNSGIDESTGTGDNQVGCLTTAQVSCSTFTLGNNGSMTFSNSGTNSGSGTGGHMGLTGLQLGLEGAFQAGNQLNISATNIGMDTSDSAGNNEVGYVTNHQITSDAFTVGDDATIAFFNTGINDSNGTGSKMGVSHGQFIVGGFPFLAGSGLTLSASNIGTDNSTGSGSNEVGYLTINQLEFDAAFTATDDATITLSNTGTNNGNSQNGLIGEISQQLSVQDAFSVGNNLNFSVTNSGIDNGSGTGGNETGYVQANQVEIVDTFTVSDSATITFLSEGTNTGTCQNGFTGWGRLQCLMHEAFQAGDNLEFSASNSGTDTSVNGEGNQIGYLEVNQVEFDTTFTVGESATITLSNTGTSSNESENNSTGFVGGLQFWVQEAFQAGSNLSLSVTNSGTDTSSDGDSNEIGYITSNQLELDTTFVAGDNATIMLSNIGTSSGAGPSNGTGFIGGQQFLLQGAFQAGNDLSLSASNSGTDTSGDGTGNQIGYVTNYQIEFNTTFVAGDNAVITLSNTGTSNSENESNSTGFVGGQQFWVQGSFQAGNDLVLSATNVGENSSTNQLTSNSIGFLNAPQLEFDDTFSVLDGATITVSNSGTNGSSTVDSVGYVAGDQFVVADDFSAGSNLSIIASNTASTSAGNSNVGAVASQIHFSGSCSVGDGAAITASNNGAGSVSGSQIWFENGLTLTSGSATLQATNEGTVGGEGIFVQGDSPGGDLIIILQGTSLDVDTSSPGFLIGSLTGDNTSSAQTNVALTINSGSSVNANYLGSLSAPSLTKSGSGVQTLSGTNTISGLTTLNEGVLVLNGSLSGDILVNNLATLKGNGTIVGSATIDGGTIAPGQSIGTLYMATYTNNDGTYDLEVNSLGESDLISVTGAATINGGSVYLSSTDGGYLFNSPYTIVEAASVTGSYSGVVLASPTTLISPSLSYDAEHVYLTVTSDVLKGAKTFNQRAVATQLDTADVLDSLQLSLLTDIVNLPSQDVSSALASVSGWQYTNDFFVAETVHNEFIKRMYDPLRLLVTTKKSNCECLEADCCNDYTAWCESGGTHTQLSGNSNAFSIVLNGYEVTTGIQKTFFCDWTLGALGSFEHDHIHYSHQGGSGGSDTWLVGLYGLYRPSIFYTMVDFAYGHSLNHMDRSINFGSTHLKAYSKPQISQFTFYGEIGADWNLCSFLMIQQFLGIETGAYWSKDVSENFAGGWGLAVDGQDRDFLNSRVGFHITSNGLSKNLALSLDLAWDRQYFNNKNTLNEEFIQFGDPFKIKGVNLGSNSFDYALTINQCINKNWNVYLRGSGQIWNQAYQCNALLGAEFSW